jgi:hypothetical protein
VGRGRDPKCPAVLASDGHYQNWSDLLPGSFSSTWPKVHLQHDTGNLVGRGPKCYVATSGFVGQDMVSIPRKNDAVSS